MNAFPATSSAVRVFISYAWEDGSDGPYRDWVKDLATRLRQDGVDARLDKWHMQEGQTIPEFMNSEIRLAEKILVVCSPQYQAKVHAKEEGGSVTGSGWESMLVSSAMFTGERGAKVVAV
ncbi:MAG: toll/interleukin-1 receptor domain-containing protein, partial [Nitrospira sp.]|nr:toll/interleukin-1 receptor domain-containing protein [Nitrospira sp.]